MPPKGKGAEFTLSDVLRIVAVLTVMMGIIIVALGIDLGALRWEPYSIQPDYTVTFSSGVNNSVSFNNGAVVYQQLENASSAFITIQIEVFCEMANGSWYELGELITEEWANTTMQFMGNQTWQASVQIEALQSRTFALRYCQPEKRHMVSCYFVLEDYKGTVRVRPV